MSYLNDFSMSVGAANAKAEGKLTASEFGKRLGVSAAAVKKVLGEDGEWHHTSSRYNITNFYEIEDLTANGLREAIKKVKEMRAFDSAKKALSIAEKFTAKKLEYLEWGGTRRHPTAEKIILENVPCEKKGDWISFNGLRKNVNTRGFSYERI